MLDTRTSIEDSAKTCTYILRVFCSKRSNLELYTILINSGNEDNTNYRITIVRN